MKIGVYQQTIGSIGGSEFLTAAIASCLRDRHEVEIVHHVEGLSLENLSEAFGIPLGEVRSRFVASHPWGTYGARRFSPFVRWRRWNAEVSRGYDLFIANVHQLPPHCHASRGIINVLFPMFGRGDSWPSHSPRQGLRGWVDRFRGRSFDADWPRRFGTYQTKLAISRYAADWAHRRWGLACEVLNPPMPDPGGTSILKAPAIVSLARFCEWKQQREMLIAYRDRVAPRAPGWEMVFVGALGDAPQDREYFSQLKELATGLPVRLVTNATRQQVRDELSRARIFWHAMGLGVSELEDPMRIEHFGIATVESMALGCVPVVINKGGQAEIVHHGECGYTSGDAAEMAEFILGLTRDPSGWSRMSAVAMARASEFRMERFAERLLAITGIN